MQPYVCLLRRQKCMTLKAKRIFLKIHQVSSQKEIHKMLLKSKVSFKSKKGKGIPEYDYLE